MTTSAATLPAALRGYAESLPDGVALRDKEFGLWGEICWKEYWTKVTWVGHALADLGVVAGGHVGILADNRPEWLYADLASQGLGARSVGIYQTNPAADVAYVVTHSEVRVLFVEDQEQVDKIIEIGTGAPTLEHVIVFDPRGTQRYEDSRLQSWESFIARGEELATESPGWFSECVDQMDPKAPSMVVYTSGTTGQPKGALLSNTNVMELGTQAAGFLGVSESDYVLSYLPLCHVAEKIFSLFLPLSVGAVVHFGESIDTVREDLAQVSPTVFLGVPRIWEKMHAEVILKMQDSSWLKRTLFHYFQEHGLAIAKRRSEGSTSWWDRVVWLVGDLLVYRPIQERLGLRNCWMAFSGAAPIAPELLWWFWGLGIRISEGYGQTESSGVSHGGHPGQARIGTVGQALPGIECVLAEDGEILIRSASVFCGYLHNEEATRATVNEEGWLMTGDIGSIDEDGYLRITGRKKEIIITAGGKNLSPEKIENTLKMSTFIKEVVAIGDRRKFISALIQIDYPAVSDWASRRDLSHTSFADLSGKDEVEALIKEEILRVNERLARVEQVRSFRLLRKELHQDDGELTATQKVRRGAVVESYATLIESMYGGAAP